VVIPVKPRSFDLWGVDQTAELVREAREVNAELRAIVVLNEGDAKGKDNDEAVKSLREIEGLEMAPMLIGRRKAFPNAASAGLSVLEWHDHKAIDEFSQLVRFLFGVSPRDIGSIINGYRKES
jgi:chromosome partitioning protein